MTWYTEKISQWTKVNIKNTWPVIAAQLVRLPTIEIRGSNPANG